MKNKSLAFFFVNTVVDDELNDLNAQLTSINEHKQTTKRKEREDLRAE